MQKIPLLSLPYRNGEYATRQGAYGLQMLRCATFGRVATVSGIMSPSESPTRAESSPRKLTGVAANPALRGRGPKPGSLNAGRPRDEWKAWLRTLVDSASTRDAIAAILSDPTHPAFPRVLSWADERGYGKEAQAIDGALTLTVVRRDETAK